MFKRIDAEAEFADGVMPFIVAFAVVSLTMAFTIIEAVVLATAAVYAVIPGANAGVNEPLSSVKLARAAFDDAARVTVVV